MCGVPPYAVTAIHTHAEYPPHCTSPRLLRVWGHATGRPRAAYHTRTPERAPYRGGKRGVPWLHTTYRRTGLARHGLDTFSLDNPANRRDNGRKLELSLQAMRPLATWRTLMT